MESCLPAARGPSTRGPSKCQCCGPHRGPERRVRRHPCRTSEVELGAGGAAGDFRQDERCGICSCWRMKSNRSARDGDGDSASSAAPHSSAGASLATAHRFLDDVRLDTCSAEDLVVLKAFADRSRDWADIEGVLLRSGHRIAWETIRAELEPLCEAKDAPHILPRLTALRGGR